MRRLNVFRASHSGVAAGLSCCCSRCRRCCFPDGDPGPASGSMKARTAGRLPFVCGPTALPSGIPAPAPAHHPRPRPPALRPPRPTRAHTHTPPPPRTLQPAAASASSIAPASAAPARTSVPFPSSSTRTRLAGETSSRTYLRYSGGGAVQFMSSTRQYKGSTIYPQKHYHSRGHSPSSSREAPRQGGP